MGLLSRQRQILWTHGRSCSYLTSPRRILLYLEKWAVCNFIVFWGSSTHKSFKNNFLCEQIDTHLKQAQSNVAKKFQPYPIQFGSLFVEKNAICPILGLFGSYVARECGQSVMWLIPFNGFFIGQFLKQKIIFRGISVKMSAHGCCKGTQICHFQ